MIRRKLTGVKRNEVRKALKHKAHRMFVLNEKRTRRNRKDEAFTNGWDSLMYECIDVETASDAMDYFVDVEKTAEKLNILCADGKPFMASVAIKEWDRLEKHVERMCDELQEEYGEDLDDLPCLGLNYFRMDDTLAIGIFDRGNFDAYVEWEFREAMSDRRQLETRRPIRLNVSRRKRF